MHISITQILQELIYEQLEVPCIPTGDTVYVDVDISIYDVMNNGVILHYGDYDPNKKGAIKRIQKKLGIKIDGYYGPTMLETLSTTLDIDLCDQKDNVIPIGPNALTKLGLFDVKLPDENTDEYVNYILASTLVGECNRCGKDELFAIYSTIKHRSGKSNMVEAVLKPKQYSTWNRYNNADDKLEFLTTRISTQKRKGFDEMLSLVKEFRNKSPLKYNHYVNPTIVDLETSKRSIAKSYRDNIESSKQIGEHMFWWDKKHK